MSVSSSVTIGYRYYLGMHLVICYGPVDSVNRIIAGEREAWAGNVTASQQIEIDEPELFGGEKKEGGIQGKVDIMMGEPIQGANPYLAGQLGPNVPGFRGLLSLVLRKVYLTSMSPYPKKWAIEVTRIPGRAWYNETSNINGGSANGVHIIYECLTSTEWGQGLSSAVIDDAAFRAAALTVYNEGLGLSMLLNSQSSAEDFIYEVLRHINGVLFTRPDNGQFSIRLLRDDYDPDTLPLYNESNIIALESFERPTYAEMVNEVVVKYRKRGSITDDSVTVHDLASIQAQQGIVSQTMSYPGIDDADNAARLGLRDLRQKSTPLARVVMRVNRKAWNLTPGECIKFAWAEHGISSLILRVLKINYGELRNSTITVDAVEDVFGLPSATYMAEQPSEWVDPQQPPQNYPIQIAMDALYLDVYRSITQPNGTSVPVSAAFIAAYAGEVLQFTRNYELHTRIGGAPYAMRAIGDMEAPHGLLLSSIGPTDTALSLGSLTSGSSDVAAGSYAFIEDEIVAIVSLDVDTGACVVVRGVLDTVPTDHSAAVRVLFADYGRTLDTTQYASGGAGNAKLLMRTSSHLMDINLATQQTVNFVGRQGKPYPPANVKINDVFNPIFTVGTLSITWAGRNRLTQGDQLIGWFTGHIAPESGTGYTIRIRRVDTDAIVVTRASIPVTPTGGVLNGIQGFVLPGVKRYKLEMFSGRAGNNSLQTYVSSEFDVTGYGLDFGTYYGGLVNPGTFAVKGSPPPVIEPIPGLDTESRVTIEFSGVVAAGELWSVTVSFTTIDEISTIRNYNLSATGKTTVRDYASQLASLIIADFDSISVVQNNDTITLSSYFGRIGFQYTNNVGRWSTTVTQNPINNQTGISQIVKVDFYALGELSAGVRPVLLAPNIGDGQPDTVYAASRSRTLRSLTLDLPVGWSSSERNIGLNLSFRTLPGQGFNRSVTFSQWRGESVGFPNSIIELIPEAVDILGSVPGDTGFFIEMQRNVTMSIDPIWEFNFSELTVAGLPYAIYISEARAATVHAPSGLPQINSVTYFLEGSLNSNQIFRISIDGNSFIADSSAITADMSDTPYRDRIMISLKQKINLNPNYIASYRTAPRPEGAAPRPSGIQDGVPANQRIFALEIRRSIVNQPMDLRVDASFGSFINVTRI